MPLGEAQTAELLLRVNNLMQEATTRGDYKEVQRLARIAEELSSLERREKEIAQSRENLATAIEHRPQVKIDDKGVSARERGKLVRHHYVESTLPLHGIQLNEISTKKYSTVDGRLVGITYAKELESRPSFWFLGLSDEPFDCVVLLCESSEATAAEIAALVLPSQFLTRIWKALSRSEGQVKFHVARTDYMNFELRLPGSDPLNVSRYLNAVQPLNRLNGGSAQQ